MRNHQDIASFSINNNIEVYHKYTLICLNLSLQITFIVTYSERATNYYKKVHEKCFNHPNPFIQQMFTNVTNYYINIWYTLKVVIYLFI